MSRTAALFGGPSVTKSNNLIELKAGKMLLKDSWVVPDKRAGLLYLHQSRDGLMHFCWKDRTASQAEDDILVFPEEAQLLPVKKCTTGRVYILKFKTGRSFFYWMQEPNADKDEDNVKTINRYFNEPPARSGRSVNGASASIGSQDMQDIFNNLQINQPDLLALLSMGMGNDGPAGVGAPQARVGGSLRSTVPASSSSIPASPSVPPSNAAQGSKRSRPNTGNVKFKLEDIQNIFSTIVNTGPSQRVQAPLLADVLTSDNLEGVVSKDDAETLIPYLPDDGNPIEDSVKKTSETITSPFFKAAVRSFSTALQSGEIDQVVTQFHLGSDAQAAANSGDVVAFAEALEASTSKKESTEAEPMEAEEVPKVEETHEEEKMEKE